MRQAQNRALKEQLKQNIQMNKTGFEEKVKTHAETVKQEKRDQKDFMHIQK